MVPFVKNSSETSMNNLEIEYLIFFDDFKICIYGIDSMVTLTLLHQNMSKLYFENFEN